MKTRRSPRNQDRLFRELGKEKAPSKFKALLPVSFPVCEWKEDDLDGLCFHTCCGAYHSMDNTPEENKMKFCCYCGKQLKQVLFRLKEAL